jgi:hypothetical protein
MSWSWNDVYPGKRMVRLILDEDQVALLTELRGVHAVAPDTYKLADDAVIAVRGGGKEPPQPDMPKRLSKGEVEASPAPEKKAVKTPSKRPQKVIKPAPKPTQTTAAKTPAAPAKKPKPARATQKAMAHLAAGAVKQLRRTVSDDLPPRPPAEAHPPSVVSKGDLALVSKAIANGEVSITVCPPMTFTPEDEVVPLNEPAKMRKHRMARRKQRLEREGAQQEAKGV